MSYFNTFPRFSEFPKEIRLAIWEAAVPGPRIVDIRQKLLKIGWEEWESKAQEHKFELQKSPDLENTDEILDDESLAWLDSVLLTRQRENVSEESISKLKASSMIGLQSSCQIPAMLLACRESYEVASRFYERAFKSPAAFAETYFDFHRDIFYVRYDKFFRDPTPFEDLFYAMPRLISKKQIRRIENLAILVSAKRIQEADVDSFEDLLVPLLNAFGGVKRLTLVARHVADYPENTHDHSSLSFVRPIDTDLLELYWGNERLPKSKDPTQRIYNIPELDTDWMDISIGELIRIRNGLPQDKPRFWPIPKLYHRIVIPSDYQQFLDFIHKKHRDTLEWAKRQRKPKSLRQRKGVLINLAESYNWD